jgi:hypothetical protein
MGVVINKEMSLYAKGKIFVNLDANSILQFTLLVELISYFWISSILSLWEL